MGISGRGFSREEDQALLPEKPGGQVMMVQPGLARGRAQRRQWWAGGRGRQCDKGRLQPPRQAPVCWAEPSGDPTSLEVTVVTIRGQRHRVFPAETQEAAKTGNTHRGALSGSGSLERPGHPRPGGWQRRPAREGSTHGWRKLGTSAPLPRHSCSQRGAVLAF